MERERAAAELGIEVDADAATIAAAFQRAARTRHPDLEGGDADAFRRAVEARDELLATVPRGGRPPADSERTSPGVIRRDAGPRPHGPWLVAAWMGILLVAAFLGVYGLPHPLAPWEPIVRWVVLGGAFLGYALTGRRGLLVAGAVAVVVTLVTTLFVTTLGALVGLMVGFPAVYGLVISGRARERLARAAAARRG